jgi:hypothetical protein
VVGNGENCNSVFKLLLNRNVLFCLLLSFLSVWKEVHAKSCLHNHDGLLRMLQRQFVAVKLRQDSAKIQMCVCLCSRLRKALLNLHGLFQLDQGRAQMPLFAVVASEVVVCHGESVVIVLSQFEAAV